MAKSVTTSTALTALLTQISMTAAQVIKFGGPADVAASSMDADHLAQALIAMGECAKSSEYRF